MRRRGTMLALVDSETVHPACVSLGMEGSLDQRSARRLAELAGCSFHPLILGEGFLENFRQHLERMVGLTDGHYLDQCIVMPTFPLYESLGIRVLLRGHAGELLHMHKAYNFSVDDAFRSTATVQLGMIAYESHAVIQWDREALTIPNDPSAAALLKRDYRRPWTHPYDAASE